MNADKRTSMLASSRMLRWYSLFVVVALGFSLFPSKAFGGAQSATAGEAMRLDLNKATAEELDTLPEVGPKLAKAIVAFREKSGPFRRVEDLLAVPGISKRRLEKIRPRVYVEPPKRESASAPQDAR